MSLFAFFVSEFVLSCRSVIYFHLILISTGSLAPLAPTVIPGSQYSNLLLVTMYSIINCRQERVQIKIVVVV